MLPYLVSSRSIQIHNDCLHSKSATSAPILPPLRTLTLSLPPSLRANPYSCSLFRDLESSRQKSSGAYRDLEKFSTELPGAYQDLESSRQNSRRPIGTSKVLYRNPRCPYRDLESFRLNSPEAYRDLDMSSMCKH
jgi:hypothetical protein